MSHEIGIVIPQEGNIWHKGRSRLYDKFALLLDVSNGGFLQHGDPIGVKNRYEKLKFLLSEVAEGWEKDLSYVLFDCSTGIMRIGLDVVYSLSVDEMCTIINYLSNDIRGTSMRNILGMNVDLLRDKLAELQEKGF